jgi:hypothetical protein
METIIKELEIKEGVVKKMAITPLPPKRALKSATKILRLIGGALQNIKDGNPSIAFLAGLAANVSDSDMDFLLDELLYQGNIRIEIEGQLVEATPAILDIVFAGNIFAMLKAMWLSAEVNYGNFPGGKLLARKIADLTSQK